MKGIPTILFTNAKAEEVYRIPGFMPAADFLKEMKTGFEKAEAAAAKPEAGGAAKKGK